ncbi:MAG: Ldh family oxidoreductase, partial [Armatimonadetes bacterium]|nr:Ldh family oxidoreductase [Armatimonadota bacterium]
MATSSTEYIVYPVEILRNFGRDCFHAAGMSPEDAALAARLLVRTELRGVESHGVRWFPNYCRALRDGKMNPAPSVTLVSDAGALLLVDGEGGLGHVVTYRAMEHCLARAESLGAAFVAVRNSRHNGAASLYALQAMEAGFIGLSMTSGGVRVAPAGGSEALLGTNPIAFAAPV